MKNDNSKKLIDFIEKSPSAFHVVSNIRERLLSEGVHELKEHSLWEIKSGESYFVTRNMSSIIAFKVPNDDYVGFNIVSSHSDSPTFKIKENAEIDVNSEYIKLNTERYGGMILSTWLDRPLSVAGRIVVREGNNFITKLVNVDKDLLIIPNVAVHMDRTTNDGKKFNAQVDMLPLMGDITSKGEFLNIIAKASDVDVEKIISTDLYLYAREKGRIIGANDEYVCSPKLDDLQCAYTSMEGFIKSKVNKSIAVFVVFDNEEVGSGTKQGAASTFLFDTLTRVNSMLGKTQNDYLKALASSFMISADNAHAVHPNQTSFADPTNKPYINKGIVIKYNANQKYTSDAISAAIFKGILDDMKIPYQSFANRSDLTGGSTLGNISNTQVALNTVDIGLPQLAMHSIYETAGTKDTDYFIDVCEKFYGLTVRKIDNDNYIVE
ncbi:MAG: M18 family aminopeptidase [Oscillospiraceae bacterium]